jgi:hypothetical protein
MKNLLIVTMILFLLVLTQGCGRFEPLTHSAPTQIIVDRCPAGAIPMSIDGICSCIDPHTSEISTCPTN